MSCSKCGSVKTSCGCKDSAYTTPKVYTCPPDTSCPQPVRCSEFMDAACIFLNDGIADAGIQPGSSLESIVQQLILLVTNPGCVDAPGGVPGGGTVTSINAIWPGNAITIAGGPIQNSGEFIFNGNGTSLQYIDGQGNLQTFPSVPDPIEFQTNGTPNSVQNLLNLVAGSGVTLTESGGSVTIDVDANVYTVDNGLSPDPTDPNNFQLGSQTAPGAPLIHDTYIAGSQYRFEINNTNAMFLQGNRVDIEGAAAGAMLLSTGGPSDNSIEVDGSQVAIESVGTGSTRIFLDPTMIRVQTPLYNIKNNNDVLTLIDSATGEVEFMPITGVLLQTNGSDNADQTLLNLVSGNGITLTNVGGDVTIDGPTFQTNGSDNGSQTLLNLIAGTGITLTEINGEVTIDADAPAINLTTNDTGGASTYNPLTGDLNIPIYQTQLDVQEEGSSVVINPEFLNFIGTAVTVTASGLGADVTITGSDYNGDQGVWKETTSSPETFMLGAPLGSGSTIKFMEDREVDTDTHRLEMIGLSNILRLIQDGATPIDTDAPLVVASDSTFYAGTFTGVNNPAVLAYTTGNDTYALEVTNAGTGALSYAARFQSDPGHGLQVDSLSNSSFSLNAAGSSNNSIDSVLYIWKNTTGVASVGEGTSIIMSPGTDGAGSLIADGIVLNSILSSSSDVEFRIDTTNAGSLQPSATFKGDGEIRFHEYGVGTFANPATYILGVDASGNVVETTAAGLAIEVDGSPFSSASLLNFTTSADIGVTDLGGGAVSFSLVTPIVTYTSDEGVWDDSDVFKLGAPTRALSISDIPFTQDRHVYTDFSGLLFEGQGADDHLGTVQIINTGNEGTALNVQQTGAGGGTGIRVIQSTTANIGLAVTIANGPVDPVEGNSTGISVFDITNSEGYVGIDITSQSANTIPLRITRYPLNITANLVEKYMILRAGQFPVINNMGGSIDFQLLTSTFAYQDSNRFITRWFNSTNASRTSQFEIQGVNNAITQTQFTILGGGTSGPGGAWSLTPGQIKFDRYAAGAIYKSATDLSSNSGFNLGIDSNGNIWATDFSTGTGGTGVQDISIGTLSNGASATVTNPTGPSATINITGQNAYTQISADSGSASADVYNSAFSVVGADGITTSVTNGTSPASDVITVTGPDKYLNFVTKNISGGTIATYTPTIWNETLNIQAGTGITITNGGSPNTIVISGGAGTGTVSNVSGVNANGFTVGVANGTTTPAVTVGTSINGVLVGDGTGVSAVTGTGVMVFSGTSYSFQTLPTVNDGQIVIGANGLGLTNTSVALVNSAGGVFTANKATNSTYLLNIGPAIANLVTLMTAAMPVNPPVSGGAVTALPPYIVKTGQDTYTVQTPVTTFSPGSTGFTVTSLVSSATTGPLNGAVVLGGSLNVTSGGTGLTTSPGEGQILIGNSTGGFSIGNITAGTPGITVTSSGSGIQISATGSTVSVLNGLHTHAADGSIRLGSGNVGDVIRPLIESTDVRMNGQFYRLSNSNTGYITDIGFQIDDASAQKVGFFGASTSTNPATANLPATAFIFSGVGGTALTTYSGFYINNTTSADPKFYIGRSGSLRQEILLSQATPANNKITQVGTWNTTANQTFYEAIPSARTIQIGAASGNNTWIKLDDANQRVDINKGIIVASAYGLGAVTGTLAFLLGVDAADGKVIEIAGRSISRIVSNSGTYDATAFATSASPVAMSIVGTGTISTSIVGNVLTISSSATAFPYWSTIAMAAGAGTTGVVTGDANVIPNTVGANTLNLVAGNNITLTGSDSSNRIQIDANLPTLANSWGNINITASGGTASGGPLVPDTQADTLGFIAGAGITLTGSAANDTLTIASSGITSIVTGAGSNISITTVGGATTITGPNIWYTIAVPTPGGSLPAQTSLTPDAQFDTLSFVAGNGISIATNSTTDTITISATGGAGTVNADQGLWKDTTANPNEIELGSPTDGPAAFTVDRFINANANTLFIKGTPGAGDADLVVTSNSTGRAIRAINTISAAEGAIYATAITDASPDSAPTGVIYSESTGKGHAIVGISAAGATDAIAGIFGRGRQGVKGYTIVADGIGVFAQSVTGLGIGVFAEAVGNGTTSYAGVFGTTNTTAAKQEIIKVSKNASGPGEGATIGFYGGTNKKGQIGYVSPNVVTSSQYEATVVNSGTETVRHTIYPSGQHNFSAYGAATALFAFPSAGGSTIARALAVEPSDTPQGMIYEVDIVSAVFSPTLGGWTPATLSSTSASTSTYSVYGKLVTVNSTITFSWNSSQAATTKSLRVNLPSNYTFSQAGNLVFSWRTFRSTTYFASVNFTTGTTGTQSYIDISFTTDTTIPANFSNIFAFTFTYITT